MSDVFLLVRMISKRVVKASIPSVVKNPHQDPRSRREEAHSIFRTGDQCPLTSAATAQGFKARNFVFANSLRIVVLLLLLPLVALHAAAKPNFIIILCDDLGYNDLGCFGSPLIATPRIDQLAREGMRFTSFYAQTVCGPSRAALMTGCYPLRVAVKDNAVEIPPRLHSKEITIAEVLKPAGYATAAFGKWDLAGHSQDKYEPDLLPCHQGFDYFFGTPTSNDSRVNLLRNNDVIERNADMGTLTRRYTDEAIAFIRTNQHKPFFVYLAHTMPHVRLAASEQFKGKSKRGLYGDVVEEIDCNTGRLLDALKELKLDTNTCVVFTSDNGPWIKPPGKPRSHGGNAGPLRGGKTSSWDGGERVPCVMWSPGRIPASTTCREVASTMDILPTFAKLAGGQVPTDRVIDGHDITPLLHGQQGATSPTEAFYFYVQNHLQAVRAGDWKLVLPRPVQPPWLLQDWNRYIEAKDVIAVEKPMLFSYSADIGEQRDIAAEHPEVVTRLLKLAEWARSDIGDYNRVGRNARFVDPGPHRPDAEKWVGDADSANKPSSR